MDGDTRRLFIGFAPPPPISDALATLSDKSIAARWQTAAQHHVTLAFLGDVPGHRIHALQDTLNTLALPPVRARCQGVGYFARKGKVHSLWVGVAPAGPIAVMRQAIMAACVRAGVPPEQPMGGVSDDFQPHITLARLSVKALNIVNYINQHAGFKTELFTVRAFSAYQSQLTPDGSRYQALASYALD